MTPDRIRFVVITGKLQILIITELDRSFLIGRSFTPKLDNAKDRALRDWQYVGEGTGIRWPQLDEEISLHGLAEQARREQWPGRNDNRYHPSALVVSKAEIEHLVQQLRLLKVE